MNEVLEVQIYHNSSLEGERDGQRGREREDQQNGADIFKKRKERNQ